MKYTKLYSSPSELISILQNRGLDCTDTDNAIDILNSIGYYRLSGYFYPFLLTPKSEHIFKPGSTFGRTLKLYEFDRELRQLVFNQIERIEVAVRSAIINITCAETNDVLKFLLLPCQTLESLTLSSHSYDDQTVDSLGQQQSETRSNILHALHLETFCGHRLAQQ